MSPEWLRTAVVGLGAGAVAWLFEARTHSEGAWESALRVVLGDLYAGDGPLLGVLGRAWLELRWWMGATGEGIALLSELSALSAGIAAALLFRALQTWTGRSQWALAGTAAAVASYGWWSVAVSWGPAAALIPLTGALVLWTHAWRGEDPPNARFYLQLGLLLGVAAALDRSALWLLPGTMAALWLRDAPREQLPRLAGATLGVFIPALAIGSWLAAVAGETPPLPTIAASNQSDEVLARLTTGSTGLDFLLAPLVTITSGASTLGLLAALVPLGALVALGVLLRRRRSSWTDDTLLALPVLAAIPLALLEAATGSVQPLLPLVPFTALAATAILASLTDEGTLPWKRSFNGLIAVAVWMALVNAGTDLYGASRLRAASHSSTAGDTYFPSESEAGAVFGDTRSFPTMNADGGGMPGTGGAMGPPGSQPSMGAPGMGGPSTRQPSMGGPGMGQPGMGQPGMGGPGMGQPGMGGPGMGQPGMGGPGMGQPGIGGPGTGQPILPPGQGQMPSSPQ